MSDEDNADKLNQTLEYVSTGCASTSFDKFDQLVKSDYQVLNGVMRHSIKHQYIIEADNLTSNAVLKQKLNNTS